MSPRHLIRLLDEQRSQWLALDRAGRVLSGPHAGFPSEPAEHTLVLVPSEDVLVLAAPRVARQLRQMEQAVAFAIEDQLVAPVEQAHVAILGDLDDEQVLVAVVARSTMDAWLQRLSEHGVVADRLLPEACLLPFDLPTVLLEGERATLRLSASKVLSGNHQELSDWQALLHAHDDGSAWSVLVDRDTGPVPAVAGSVQSIDTSSWLAARSAQLDDSGHSLLTGPYQTQRGRTLDRLWRVAAALVLASAGLAMASMAVERWQLDRVRAQQRVQMETLLRETVPDIQRVVDPRAQMLGEYSRRRGQGEGGSILSLLSRIAPTLAGSGLFTPEAVEYRGDTLDFTLRSKDVATLDELRERVANLGLKVELVSMVPGSASVEGKLRIRGGGQ
ncbi:MAG TPA: type II secretion system protein GspL [Chiayiivirga sp.]|nr:type II secretion system protein GspL [Chiayiivirga sp.]